MCGIFGSTRVYNNSILEKKIKLMSSRGPNFSNFQIFNNAVVLGHTRLAVIDLDSRANQPFSYKHLSVVFNGEIYNFKELRIDLEKAGHLFSTSSDTEIICATYLEHGEKCVNYFNGMFAFVIFDRKNNVLFGARDRLGKKPFFYTLRNSEFEFASQLNVLAVGNKNKLAQKSITDYFLWGYIPDPNSIYEGVYKLKAGYKFTYNLTTKVFKESKYWDLKYTWDNKFSGSYQDALSKLDSLLKNAVKLRMISDVPLGIFLSGGIDSSLIAALAQDQSMSKIKTFSIKFNESSFNEAEYAKSVASHINSDHTEVLCDYSAGIDLIQSFSKYYDEPFADSSAIPSLILAKNTKDFVTVALSGDGGDESFIGYQTYKDILSKRIVFSLPYSFRRLLSIVVGFSPNYKHNLIAGGLKLKNINEFHYSFYTGINKSWILNVSDQYQYQEVLYSEKPLLERITDFDLKTFLTGDINTKVDKATMAYSLETRAPLMDYNVVEFARSLPTNFKYSKGIQKKILKDLLSNYVPKTLFDRPKAGFSVPISSWFKNELKDFVLDSINKTTLDNIPNINSQVFLKLLNDHLTGVWNHAPKIWRVLVLLNWLNYYRDYYE